MGFKELASGEWWVKAIMLGFLVFVAVAVAFFLAMGWSALGLPTPSILG